MNTKTFLSIYQTYSLEKISALNKKGLAMQYAQCEQLVKLRKEMAANNKATNKILKKNPPKIVPFPQNQEQSRCKQKVFRKFVVQFHGRKIPQNQFVVRFRLSCRRFLFFVSEHSGQHVRERNKKMQCERNDDTQAAWESYLYSIYLKNYETHILERQWAKGLCGQGILRIYRSP